VAGRWVAGEEVRAEAGELAARMLKWRNGGVEGLASFTKAR